MKVFNKCMKCVENQIGENNKIYTITYYILNQ